MSVPIITDIDLVSQVAFDDPEADLYGEEIELNFDELDKGNDLINFTNGDFIITDNQRDRLIEFTDKVLHTEKYVFDIYEKDAEFQVNDEYGIPNKSFTNTKASTSTIRGYIELECNIALVRHPEIIRLASFSVDKKGTDLNIEFTEVRAEEDGIEFTRRLII